MSCLRQVEIANHFVLRLLAQLHKLDHTPFRHSAPRITEHEGGVAHRHGNRQARNVMARRNAPLGIYTSTARKLEDNRSNLWHR